MRVVVFNNNVGGAMKLLNRKLQHEGSMRALRLKASYEKPTQRRRRKYSECIRRTNKIERKRAQQKGLIV